jgi:hypothetical protein
MSNLATFAPAVSDSSADFFSGAPAAFHRAAMDSHHGFFRAAIPPAIERPG